MTYSVAKEKLRGNGDSFKRSLVFNMSTDPAEAKRAWQKVVKSDADTNDTTLALAGPREVS